MEGPDFANINTLSQFVYTELSYSPIPADDNLYPHIVPKKHSAQLLWGVLFTVETLKDQNKSEATLL